MAGCCKQKLTPLQHKRIMASDLSSRILAKEMGVAPTTINTYRKKNDYDTSRIDLNQCGRPKNEPASVDTPENTCTDFLRTMPRPQDLT